jgi:hypothetical protein
VAAIALISPALALSPHPAEAPAKANDLLRVAIANEKLSAKNQYFAWTDRLQKPRGTVTKLMVDTPQGILARTVAINDKPLSAEERKQDDERINRLLDPKTMHDKAKRQRDDQQHIERLLFALPNAFLCEYAAPGHEDRNLRLECAPNPDFSPPNYESQILQGMKSVILIDREEKRISKIEGTLIRDVTFGWGFLAKLNRGGHIEITQARVADRYWSITGMQLAFAGRIVIVKPLNVVQSETCSDYRAVPKMNVAQALEFLRNAPAKPSR